MRKVLAIKDADLFTSELGTEYIKMNIFTEEGERIYFYPVENMISYMNRVWAKT